MNCLVVDVVHVKAEGKEVCFCSTSSNYYFPELWIMNSETSGFVMKPVSLLSLVFLKKNYEFNLHSTIYQ
jgi:hypothetical protein